MDAVRYEKKGNIAYITINRPDKMNALNMEVRQGLADCWGWVRDDTEVWVAIVTGAGEKAFCSGLDLVETNQRAVEMQGQIRVNLGNGPFWGFSPYPGLWKPVIAAINGYCLAGGFELALACDFRIAAEHATFGLPEVTRGIVPLTGAIQRLPRMIPMCIALDLLLTGERIDAARALSLGIINRVVPAAELMTAAEALAQKLNEQPPLVVQAIKEVAYKSLDMTIPQGLEMGQVIGATLRGTEDIKEGRLAFVEKRKPHFKGR